MHVEGVTVGFLLGFLMGHRKIVLGACGSVLGFEHQRLLSRVYRSLIVHHYVPS